MGFYYTLNDLIGPHELQNLVVEKRKHGIRLPFQVSIKRFSRLAYVSRWDDDEFKVMNDIKEYIVISFSIINC